MTIDDYPDLPVLPLGVQLAFRDLEPAHFLLTVEMLEESHAVGRTVRALVARYVQALGPDAVEVVTHAALLAVRHTIENAVNHGDVTARE